MTKTWKVDIRKLYKTVLNSKIIVPSVTLAAVLREGEALYDTISLMALSAELHDFEFVEALAASNIDVDQVQECLYRTLLDAPLLTSAQKAELHCDIGKYPELTSGRLLKYAGLYADTKLVDAKGIAMLPPGKDTDLTRAQMGSIFCFYEYNVASVSHIYTMCHECESLDYVRYTGNLLVKNLRLLVVCNYTDSL